MRIRSLVVLMLAALTVQGCGANNPPIADIQPAIVNREIVRFSTSPLEIKDAVRLGVLSSTDVATAELGIRQTGNEVTIAKTKFYPELYATASPSTNEGQLAYAGAGIRYTLIDFGERAAELDGKKAAVKGSKYTLVVEIETSVRNVLESYILLSVENKKLHAAQQYVQRVNGMEDGVRARVEIGISSSVDMNEMHSAKLKAATAVLETRTDESNANEALSSLIGVFPKSVHSPENLTRALSINVQSVKEMNFLGFPRIQALEAQVEEARFQQKAAKAGLLPKIGLKLGVDLGLSRSGEFSGNGLKAGPEISEVISLGGGRKERIQNAEIDVRIAERNRNEEVRLSKLETIQATNSLTASTDRVKQRKEILSLNRRTRDVMEGEYEVGNRSLRDLLDAEERIYDATVDLNEAYRTNMLAQLRYVMSVNQSSNQFYEQPL